MASTLSRLVNGFAYEAGDSREVRAEKNAIMLVAGACCVAGSFWTAMYAVIYGWSLTTSLPALFVVFVGGALVVAHLSKRLVIAVYAQIIAIMGITAGIQWSIGGVFDSGIVIVWAFLGPLVALMFRSVREAAAWFALFALMVLALAILDGPMAARTGGSSEELRRFFFALNLGVASVVVFMFAGYFVRSTISERAAANRLLLNVLPSSIAERLKAGNSLIADDFECVSVLFADAGNSTPLFAALEPAEVVDWLNEVFTTFDGVVERHGLEKLRTIGDGYMVGSGIPVEREDHATALVRCALELIEAVDKIPPRNGKRIEFRFGINSGPAVAGVIGSSKFHYDVWGDAINVAARMETTGELGRVHISDATHELVRDAFECEPRGTIEVKGKGMMETWFVVGPRSAL